MKTIKIELFRLDELGENAKNKVIENWRNTMDIELDMFALDCENIAKEHGFNRPEIRYSLGYSQGDGLNFQARNYDKLPELINSILGKGKGKTAQLIAENCGVNMKGNSGRYGFASESDVELELEYRCAANFDIPLITAIINQAKKQLQNIYIALCKGFEANGYAEIEHQQGDEYIADSILNNDYWYLEDGTEFND